MKTAASQESLFVSAGAETGEFPRRARSSCAELVPGSLVAGKYRVGDVLGRGGFAVVYAAEHLSLGREVALKVLHRDDTTHAVLLERFSREMRISALVRHPHVLEVYDAGTLEDGSPFLAMEKIGGLTLQQELDAVQRLSIDDTLELCTQLLWALMALSERGIVHRDIKPENLMLVRDLEGGRLHLKLVDFGISLIRQERVERRLTQRGTLIGTPHYMAPEQLRREVTDARVDLYSTGVVIYQALTGRVPYDGEDLSSLTLNVLNGEARAIRELRPDCPSDLARIVERALARAPEDRYPDAAAMLADLLVCSSEATTTTLLRSWVNRQLGVIAHWARDHGKQLAVALIALSGSLCLGWSASDALQAAVLPDSEPEVVLPRASEEILLAQASSAHVGAPSVQATPFSSAAQYGAEVPSLPAIELGAGGLEPSRGARTSAARAMDPRSLARKALALYLNGQTAAAYALYRRAADANPADLAALRGLGLTAARLARIGEARRAFAHYLELAPGAPDARAVRARLAALPVEISAR